MKQADYGLDAPHVVRNLYLCGLLAFVCAWISFRIIYPLFFWCVFSYFLLNAIGFILAAAWTSYSSRVLKPKLIAKLVQELDLKGTDTVLDIGCGRGMLLIEMAKKLTSGNAYGIDLWSRRDQSFSRIEATIENAEAEGVRNRVHVKPADARMLPYEDETFDAVVSSLVVHNIRELYGRELALSEMLRVLKPGGKFFILDFLYSKQYAAFIKDTGLADVSCSKPIFSYCPPLTIVRGTKKQIE